MKKITGETLNITDENIKIIAKHFPEAMEEGKIKFDVLKELLGEFIEESNERYQFTWNGKSQALKLSQTQSTGTLLPCKEKSKNWDTTENLYIEGDNLEVLKLLQKSYYKEVKMIYIDPPYNTGNDFVYKDDFKDNIKNYKQQTNQQNKANAEIQGRFHTNWLNMIYPRLRLAKNLLKDDGVIYISIDEHEISNLTKIVAEIFGENNYEILIWRKNGKQGNTKVVNRFKTSHEYIVVAYKNKANTSLGKMKLLPNWQNEYPNPDKDPRGNYKAGNISLMEEKSRENSPNYYSITTPTGKVYTREWFISKEEFEKLDADKVKTEDGRMVGRIYYPNNGDGVPALKIFKNEEQFYYFDSIIDEMGTFTDAHKALIQLFEEKDLFPTPKPIKVIKELIRVSTKENDLVLDFFAGSATTAHALMELNEEDRKNRKFILVQLPELYNEKADEYKMGYKNICEVSEERIKRAGDKIKKATDAEIDYGFKVFKLDSSNIKLWNGEFNTEEDANNYFLEHLKPLVEGRTDEDLLYELLLKEGMSLTSQIEEINIGNKTIYSVNMGYLIICLEETIDMNLVEEIGRRKPKTIIFKDSGFIDENVKINTIQELKKYGIEEETIKSI